MLDGNYGEEKMPTYYDYLGPHVLKAGIFLHLLVVNSSFYYHSGVACPLWESL